jgi:hypothetical protein
MRRNNDDAAVVAFFLWFVFVLCVNIALIWAAVHFIRKYW